MTLHLVYQYSWLCSSAKPLGVNYSLNVSYLWFSSVLLVVVSLNFFSRLVEVMLMIYKKRYSKKSLPGHTYKKCKKTSVRFSCYWVIKWQLLLTSPHLNERRLHQNTLLLLKGQFTEHITVKWTFNLLDSDDDFVLRHLRLFNVGHENLSADERNNMLLTWSCMPYNKIIYTVREFICTEQLLLFHIVTLFFIYRVWQNNIVEHSCWKAVSWGWWNSS